MVESNIQINNINHNSIKTTRESNKRKNSSLRTNNNTEINKTTTTTTTTTATSRVSIQYSLISGSCAGITSTIALYPLDVIRTKLQTSVGYGPIHTIRTTIQYGGIQSLYIGITIPVLAQTIYKGTVFTISNITQQYLIDYRTYYENINNIGTTAQIIKSKKLLSDNFWGGFIGGAVNGALFVTPVEFIRNQLIAQNTKNIILNSTTNKNNTNTNVNVNNSSIDIIKNVIKEKYGIINLWRGITWTIYRDSIGCGCFFYTMAYSQHILTPQNETPTLLTTIISGGIGGLSYWLSALPLDTIKTWVQSTDINTNSSASYISPINTIRTIYNDHGIIILLQRLFRGWQVAYGRGIPSAAITMTTYSYVYRYLSNGNDTFVS